MTLSKTSRLFTGKWLLVLLILAAITGFAANGPTVGTAYLKELVPGVTIPDLTPQYVSRELPGFFQGMGTQGRQAYLTINNLDFLFIISYSLFGVVAFGVLLGCVSKNQAASNRLAFLGLAPGVCDMVESICFRMIVASPYGEHVAAANIAAVMTKLKFLTITLALLTLILLLLAVLLVWHRSKTKLHAKI